MTQISFGVGKWGSGREKERERDTRISALLSICLTCVSFHPCFVSPRGEHFAGRTTPSCCRSATGQRQKGRQRRWTHSTPRDNDDALRIFFPSVIFQVSLLFPDSKVFSHTSALKTKPYLALGFGNEETMPLPTVL